MSKYTIDAVRQQQKSDFADVKQIILCTEDPSDLDLYEIGRLLCKLNTARYKLSRNQL